jgi:hypothetical protein
MMTTPHQVVVAQLLLPLQQQLQPPRLLRSLLRVVVPVEPQQPQSLLQQ